MIFRGLEPLSLLSWKGLVGAIVSDLETGKKFIAVTDRATYGRK